MHTKQSNIATFAGGCFWCMQHVFDALPGVINSIVGYTGGNKSNPSYQQVSSGTTGHLEAIQIQFDPTQIEFASLVETFLHNIDPTNSKGQFADIGPQYCTAVFYQDDLQKQIAETLFDNIISSGQLDVIYTKILPAVKFYPAEEYHQKYPEKNHERYMGYHIACGRDFGLKNIWKGKKR